MYPNLSLKLLCIELRRYVTEEPRFLRLKLLQKMTLVRSDRGSELE